MYGRAWDDSGGTCNKNYMKICTVSCSSQHQDNKKVGGISNELLIKGENNHFNGYTGLEALGSQAMVCIMHVVRTAFGMGGIPARGK